MQKLISVDYDVSDPWSGCVKVKITIDDPPPKLRWFVPVWRPGTYHRQFIEASYSSFSCTVDGCYRELSHGSAPYWFLDCGSQCSQVSIVFDVHASKLTAASIYVSPWAILLNPWACTPCFPDLLSSSWRVHCEFPSYGNVAIMNHSQALPASYESYNDLIDAPMMWGASLDSRSCVIGEDNALCTIHAAGQASPINLEDILRDIKAWALVQEGMFPNDSALKNYQYFALFPPWKAYHGVEHASGSVVLYKSGSSDKKLCEDEFTSLLSHEYFHRWNIKKMAPIPLHKPAYEILAHSELWYVVEGFTSYFGDLSLLQSNVWSLEKYIEELEKVIMRHVYFCASLSISLENACSGSWRTTRDIGQPLNSFVDVYGHGLLVGWMIDVTLIMKGSRLSSVMADLLKICTEADRGYSSEDLSLILQKHGGDDVHTLWLDLVKRCPGFRPLNRFAHKIGLHIHSQPLSQSTLSFLGMSLLECNVKNVNYISYASDYGFLKNDIIISINNAYVERSMDIDAVIHHVQEGSRVDVWVRREDDEILLSFRWPHVAKEIIKIVSCLDNDSSEKMNIWKSH